MRDDFRLRKALVLLLSLQMKTIASRPLESAAKASPCSEWLTLPVKPFVLTEVALDGGCIINPLRHKERNMRGNQRLFSLPKAIMLLVAFAISWVTTLSAQPYLI